MPGPVLLTGATGYVGGRLRRLLEEAGSPLRCLARRPEELAAAVAFLTLPAAAYIRGQSIAVDGGRLNTI